MELLRIKWIVLKNIAESICKKEVDITLSTSVSNQIISAVEYNGRVDIILNAVECKSLDMVIQAIAHELAHVVTKTSNDTSKAFIAEKEKLLEIIQQRYGG